MYLKKNGKNYCCQRSRYAAVLQIPSSIPTQNWGERVCNTQANQHGGVSGRLRKVRSTAEFWIGNFI